MFVGCWLIEVGGLERLTMPGLPWPELDDDQPLLSELPSAPAGPPDD